MYFVFLLLPTKSWRIKPDDDDDNYVDTKSGILQFVAYQNSSFPESSHAVAFFVSSGPEKSWSSRSY